MQAIAFENVSFGYIGENYVLDGASFEISEGEFVALVGDNGSGKSTIAKMIDAFLLPREGKVFVFGEDVASLAKSGSDALLRFRCGIGFVQQNPDNQFVATLVIDEVAFGPCGLGISKEEAIDRTLCALKEVDAIDLAKRDVNTLSGGEKQRVAIADALAMRPKLLVLDEPTSMLDADGKEEVMGLIREIHDKGTTILLITHSIDEAEEADRILKVTEGKVHDGSGFKSEEERVWGPILEYANVSDNAKNSEGKAKRAVIELHDVSFAYDSSTDFPNGLMGSSSNKETVFTDLSMQVNEGELLCIAGPNGSGKSTLASLMNGLLRPTSGEVTVFGTPTSSKHGSNSARRHVGVCFQYPERSLFSKSVIDEAAFGPRNLGYDKEHADKMAREALAAMGIDSEEVLETSPFELSGGLQRKVAIASVLAMKPDVLVMDEPCSGLDSSAHAELVLMLLRLKEQNQSIVMITHDERDMDILADRVIFLT